MEPHQEAAQVRFPGVAARPGRHLHDHRLGDGGQAPARAAGHGDRAGRGRPHRFWARDTSARLLLIVVPGGIEDYFGLINNASDDVERHRIGELYGIRVVPD